MDHQISAETLRRYLPAEENQQSLVLRAPQQNTGKDYSHEIGILYNMVMQNKKDLEELKELLQGAHHDIIPAQEEMATPTITITPTETAARKPIEAEEIEAASLRVEDSERDLIRKALELTKGNRKEAAARLGLSERTLYRKIKEYGL